MTAHSIQVILFDFGGVLAEEGFRNGLTRLARQQGLDEKSMPGEGMRAVYDSGFVLGKGSAADFWQLLRQRTGLKGNDSDLSQGILDGFILRPWMMQQVAHLKDQGYITGILSDQTHWLDQLDQQYHFYKNFDHIYNSFYLGKGKQDASLFDDVARQLKTAPEAILFIDDDAGNIGRAQLAGFLTLHYTEREHFLTQLQQLLGKNAKPA